MAENAWYTLVQQTLVFQLPFPKVAAAQICAMVQLLILIFVQRPPLHYAFVILFQEIYFELLFGGLE
jgi:hypothetical protein